MAGPIYKILYEKCEREAKNSGNNLIEECKEIIDEVEYLKKYEKYWESFQRHYVMLKIPLYF